MNKRDKTIEAIYCQIANYFKTYGKVIHIEDIAHKNYFELQIFDSIGFVKMITDLEAEFDITFSSQEIGGANFQTLNGIVEIIHHKISKRLIV